MAVELHAWDQILEQRQSQVCLLRGQLQDIVLPVELPSALTAAQRERSFNLDRALVTGARARLAHAKRRRAAEYFEGVGIFTYSNRSKKIHNSLSQLKIEPSLHILIILAK
jgi:hypothetical protein